MPATDDTYTIASGAELWAGRDNPLPAWVPSTLFEAALVPMTNELGDVEARGSWSYGTGGGVSFSAYSGGAFNPHYGENGAVYVHGGGHSAGNDSSVIIANLNTLAFERIGDPVNLTALGRYADYRTGSWPGVNTGYTQTSYDYFSVRGPNSTGWNDPTNSALWELASSSLSPGEYAEGKPVSVHSYNNLVILPPSLGGDPLGSLLRPVVTAGANTPQLNVGQAHIFNSTTKEWSRFGVNRLATAAVSNSSSCSLDPTRGVVLFKGTGPGFGWLDVSTGVWTDLTDASPLGNGVTSIYHGTRDIHVFVFNTPGASLIRMQYIPGGAISGASRSDVTWTNGTAPPKFPTGGNSVIDCPERGSFFYYPQGGGDNLYEILVPTDPANAWTWVLHTITGSSRPSALSPQAARDIYGRMGYSQRLKSLVWVMGQYGQTGEFTDPAKFGGRVMCIRVCS